MTKNNHFVSLYYNRKAKEAGFDVKKLTEILNAAYTQDYDKTEHLTKTGFAPSTLFYGEGDCPRRWFLAFSGADFVKAYEPYSVDNMRSGTDAHRRMQENFQNSELDVIVEEELECEDPPIHCFVDVVVKNFAGIDEIPIEIKTTRTEAFAHLVVKNEGRDYQVAQLLLYMYLKEKHWGALLYENKNDHKKLLIPVEMTPERQEKIESIISWMRLVYANWKEGELPKIPYRKNSKVCGGCQLKDWCFTQSEGTISLPTLSKYTEGQDGNS